MRLFFCYHFLVSGLFTIFQYISRSCLSVPQPSIVTHVSPAMSGPPASPTSLPKVACGVEAPLNSNKSFSQLSVDVALRFCPLISIAVPTGGREPALSTDVRAVRAPAAQLGPPVPPGGRPTAVPGRQYVSVGGGRSRSAAQNTAIGADRWVSRPGRRVAPVRPTALVKPCNLPMTGGGAQTLSLKR